MALPICSIVLDRFQKVTYRSLTSRKLDNSVLEVHHLIKLRNTSEIPCKHKMALNLTLPFVEFFWKHNSKNSLLPGGLSYM